MDPAEVCEVALAGNATMTHIALGIDPEPLGVAPFIMAARQLPEVLAADLGLPVHPRARAFLFPAFGAYVGGDITSGLIASGMDRDSRIRLFVDIGANCEIVLAAGLAAGHRGPAGLRGAAIRCGMRAADGAIEGHLDDAGQPGPAGDRRRRPSRAVRLGPGGRRGQPGQPGAAGRLRPVSCPRTTRPGWRRAWRGLTTLGQERVFVLHCAGEPGDVAQIDLPAQRDVRELRFTAKAAIATSWRILLEERPSLAPGDIQQVLLAGSFGRYLFASNAIQLGLVPKLPCCGWSPATGRRGRQDGAASVRERAGALALQEEVRYVELSDRTDFNDAFVDQLQFPA